MGRAIKFVFTIIACVLVSLILWSMIIGGITQESTDNGYFGTKTLFKQSAWTAIDTASRNNYIAYSDNLGCGYAKRTSTTWNDVSAPSYIDQRSLNLDPRLEQEGD